MTTANLRDLDKLPDSALISIQTLAVLTDEGLSTVWRKIAAGVYPSTIKLGNRCTRVRLGDVRRLLAAGGAQ